MEQTDTPTQNQLTLTDIYKMRSIIDVASTRGTFQGKELSLIGDLYNKLDGIVQAVEKANGNSPEEADNTTEDANNTTDKDDTNQPTETTQ